MLSTFLEITQFKKGKRVRLLQCFFAWVNFYVRNQAVITYNVKQSQLAYHFAL